MRCVLGQPGSLPLKTSKVTSNFIIVIRCLGQRVSGSKMIFPQDTIQYWFRKFRRRTGSGWERLVFRSKCNQTIDSSERRPQPCPPSPTEKVPELEQCLASSPGTNCTAFLALHQRKVAKPTPGRTQGVQGLLPYSIFI